MTADFPDKRIYIQPESSFSSEKNTVILKDAAKVWCSNSQTRHFANQVVLHHFTSPESNRIFRITAIELVKKMQLLFPDYAISYLGEPEILLEYSPKKKSAKALEIAKALFLCLILFCGSAFSIASFNNDVDVNKLFTDFLSLFYLSGNTALWALRISYSLGIASGILLFYNHFSRKKEESDPTPIEIEMTQYEKERKDSLLEKAGKKK